jgi:GT2 family glycosyltransferase
MNYPGVAIVVLSFNGSENTLRCLESLYQITYPEYYVIVVDNCSQDDSVPKIKEWAEGRIHLESKFLQYNPEGKPIRYIDYKRSEAEAGGDKEKEIAHLPSQKRLIIIENERNYGNAGGKNIGMRYALNTLNIEYVVLLDNDTIVSPHFLDELVVVANREPGAGILGSKIYHSDTSEVWSGGGLINYWKGTTLQRGPKIDALVEGKDAVEMDWVATCCAMVSRQMCQAVGLLDEDFTFGFEEVEIGIRATRHGFKVIYVPKSEIRHDPSHTSDDMQRRRMLYYSVTKGQFTLMHKYWSRLQFITATLYFFAHHLSYLFHFLAYSRDWDAVRLRLRGLLDFVKERNRYRRIKT